MNLEFPLDDGSFLSRKELATILGYSIFFRDHLQFLFKSLGLSSLSSSSSITIYTSIDLFRPRLIVSSNIFQVVFLHRSFYYYLLVHSRCRGCLFSLDHTQAHTTGGRTPLDEGSARRRDLYLTAQTLYKRQKNPCPRWDSNPRSQQALGRRPTP
jgi:hypothetical protein